jgi:hypothetical protein
MAATMRDVAALAGVSVKTVSRVVNLEPHTRPEVVQRVRAAIAELQWVPNGSARTLRTGRTGVVGIGVAELRRPYLAALVEALVAEADRRAMPAAVEPTHYEPDRVRSLLEARGRYFDGVVLIGPYHGSAPPDGALRDRPVVVVQGGPSPVEIDRVDEQAPRTPCRRVLRRHVDAPRRLQRRRPGGGQHRADVAEQHLRPDRYENSLPEELFEAATIDGVHYFGFFWRIALPLSKAIISVIGLYYLVQHWNDFFTGLIFVRDYDLQPLQIVLRDILLSNQAFAGGAGGAGGTGSAYGQQYADQIKYGVIVVSSLPIILLYPFLQRYFEKGVMIGSVKG